MNSNNITVTDSRVSDALYTHFKRFIADEKISEQITKSIEDHGLKAGRVIEVYPYLDTSLVKLSDGSEVEACHLHRCLGSIVDLYTPEGEQSFSEKKNEPCILPKYELKSLVAEIGRNEYVLLGYYNPNMTGAYNPADNGSYVIKTITDTSQGGLKISPQEVKITSNNGVSFKEQDLGESKEINFANSEDTYTKDELYTQDEVYTKEEVDTLIQELREELTPDTENNNTDSNSDGDG